MRLRTSPAQQGFTLIEMMVCAAITSILAAGVFLSATALNRAYTATDRYSSAHLQQIRIMDFLARDVKRSFSVTVPDPSTCIMPTCNPQTVTCIMPNYVVQTGDPEAVSDATKIGTRRTPVVIGSINKAVVDYGVTETRTVADAVTYGNVVSPSATLDSATALFTAADIGRPITGSGNTIADGTTIQSVNSPSRVTLSKNTLRTAINVTIRIYGRGNRTVTDAAATAGSPVLTSETAYFKSPEDIGKPVTGTAIPAGATIVSITNTTTATMSANAIATISSQYLTIGGTVVVYAVSNNKITRTENGGLTTIASSTDQLIPQTTDVQQANTEYTASTVTFQPIFTLTGTPAQRTGTTIFSTAYLRNKRRGN